jgi:hypothetical protein
MLYFLKFKGLTCNFCAFSHFIYFSVSFYPIWIKIISKFRENVGLHAYHLGSVLNRSRPVLGPRSFPVFLKKIVRTGTIGPLELVTVRSGSQSHSGLTNRTLKHYTSTPISLHNPRKFTNPCLSLCWLWYHRQTQKALAVQRTHHINRTHNFFDSQLQPLI